MATAVEFRACKSRFWTGSMLELNHSICWADNDYSETTSAFSSAFQRHYWQGIDLTTRRFSTPLPDFDFLSGHLHENKVDEVAGRSLDPSFSVGMDCNLNVSNMLRRLPTELFMRYTSRRRDSLGGLCMLDPPEVRQSMEDINTPFYNSDVISTSQASAVATMTSAAECLLAPATGPLAASSNLLKARRRLCVSESGLPLLLVTPQQPQETWCSRSNSILNDVSLPTTFEEQLTPTSETGEVEFNISSSDQQCDVTEISALCSPTIAQAHTDPLLYCAEKHFGNDFYQTTEDLPEELEVKGLQPFEVKITSEILPPAHQMTVSTIVNKADNVNRPTKLEVPKTTSTDANGNIISPSDTSQSTMPITSPGSKPSCLHDTNNKALKRRKSVTFADNFGRSLTEVRLIKYNQEKTVVPDFDDDEFDGPSVGPFFHKDPFEYSIPNVFRRVRLRQSEECESFEITTENGCNNYFCGVSTSAPCECCSWCLTFPQPAAQYLGFRQRIENSGVSLENITLNKANMSMDASAIQLSGTIKVLNITFEKQVHLRLTKDNWTTSTDYPATYSAELSGGPRGATSRFDTFVFQALVTDLDDCNQGVQSRNACVKLEFAIRFSCGGQNGKHEFWDNNDGCNYTITRKNAPHSHRHAATRANTMPTIAFQRPFNMAFDSLSEFGTTSSHSIRPYTLDYRPNFDKFSSLTDYRAWNHFAGETSYY